MTKISDLEDGQRVRVTILGTVEAVQNGVYIRQHGAVSNFFGVDQKDLTVEVLRPLIPEDAKFIRVTFKSASLSPWNGQVSVLEWEGNDQPGKWVHVNRGTWSSTLQLFTTNNKNSINWDILESLEVVTPADPWVTKEVIL